LVKCPAADIEEVNKMGLDQFLFGTLYNWKIEQYDMLDKDVKDLVNSMDDIKLSSIKFEVGYWRKANHIHKWFVDNAQGGEDNCEDAWVDVNKLLELKELCNKVLADNSLAEDLLPCISGFFFGSTDYDEYYFKQLEETIRIIDIAVKYKDKLSFYYSASW
jgi:hypothetical protein